MYLNIIYATHLQILNLSACFFCSCSAGERERRIVVGF